MKKIACLLCAVALVLSCADIDVNENKNSFEYFQKRLNAEMKYPSIKAVFGEPDSDIGSGIHVYVYNLEDGTRILIGYTDYIMYARHVDENNQLLNTII
jgi:hypothetical protein